MKKIIEEKIKSLLEERETISYELNELQQAITLRRDKIIEINGSIKTLQELLNNLNQSDEKTQDENN